MAILATVDCADGFLEDDALVITLALSLGLGAVVTYRPALVALDSAFATSLKGGQKLGLRVRKVGGETAATGGRGRKDTY